jgi:hypothetical protein
MDDQPLKQFQEAIDSKKLKIVNFPSLIFFCGGKCADNNADYYSMRHYMLHYLKKNHDEVSKRLIMAEKINDWYRDGHYKDLLTFEKDIAGLAEKIIIFVESPGSIAELGSFSQITEIKNKLIVFISNTHYDQESFIKNGPISYLLNESKEIVYVHPWTTKTSLKGKECIVMDNIEEYASDIATEIIKSLGANKRERTFRNTDSGHVILFMADIIDIMFASKKHEIAKMLAVLDLPDIDSMIDKYLFILQKLEIVKCITYGNDSYYIRPKTSEPENPYIQYSYKDTVRSKERIAWKMLFRDWYKKNDYRRISATRSYEVT